MSCIGNRQYIIACNSAEIKKKINSKKSFEIDQEEADSPEYKMFSPYN